MHEGALGSYEVVWTDSGPEFTPSPRIAHGYLVPGFVDIHIHGAFGIDFMSATTSELETLAAGLERCGYEGFLPTTVTAGVDEVQSALGGLPVDASSIWGVHIEGPFISPVFPGAQPKDKIEGIPTEGSPWLEVLSDKRVKVVTLAPELPGALEFTTRLMTHGVRVSMGHTNATFDEARRGFEFGAQQCTHIFNAMRGFHHREAGAVGHALTNADLDVELIYDRIHVSRDAAKLLFKCKSPDHVIAISDSSKATALPPGEKIDLWGHEAEVGRGEVRLPDGTLAGSAVTLLEVFQNLAEDFGVETAIRCCCLNPRRALKREGPPKVWLRLSEKLQIEEIVKVGGQAL